MASEKITAMIDEIKALSVLEPKELVDEICETFGVSAVAAGYHRGRRYGSGYREAQGGR